MTVPRFIQRCNVDLNGSFKYQYMGSAEFEFGGQQESLKRIFASEFSCKQVNLEIENKPYAVYMVAGRNFTFEEYEKFLSVLASNDYRSPLWNLKDRCCFSENLRKSLGLNVSWHEDTNVWFDIKNDVLFSISAETNEQLMNKLKEIKLKWKK